MSAPPTPTYNASENDASPVFTPVFAAGFMDDDNAEFASEVEAEFGFALSLDSPSPFVFSNNLEFHEQAQEDEDEDDFFQHAHHEAHDDKAASMRSVLQRDTAIAFDPRMRRGVEAFMETSLLDANSKDQSPLFVLDKVLESPTFASCGSFFPTISKNKTPSPSSPVSPSTYISNIEVPEKERSVFYSVNPTFTSQESPSKIMDTIKTALATLTCEYRVVQEWTLHAKCLLVAEELSFSIHLLQVRGSSAKYEVEFVRQIADEVIFADLAEHIRALCSDVDDEGILSLLTKTMDPWMNDKQELVGRRYAIKETEALTLIDELNCEFLHAESLYHVARSIKNHCRHKGNRKLFLQKSCGQHKNFLKGLKWMLNGSDEHSRFALFIMQQYAGDEELCSSFFATPYEKSSFSLQLDTLRAREISPKGGCSTTFTTDMVDAVLRSALFA